nr:unnamed protein product [Spirometra erinaceieuropaei]
MISPVSVVVLGVLFAVCVNRDDNLGKPVLPWEMEPAYWEAKARRNFEETARLFPAEVSSRRPRNVILFLGDGMGLQSLAAARFYKAFKARQAGRASKLVFEGWPFSTMCRTYDLETMVTDSASSATAYLTDGKPMTAVGYMNGPGARTEEPRAELHEFSSAQLTDKEFRQQALVPLSDATHGGEDVGVYATGPFSHFFHRNIDNTYLAHVMKWSLCLPPYQREVHCSSANHWPSVSFLPLIFPLLTQILTVCGAGVQ